ncbi:MAG: hypothetical protein ABL874_01575 [Sphingopyxis sp.]
MIFDATLFPVTFSHAIGIVKKNKIQFALALATLCLLAIAMDYLLIYEQNYAILFNFLYVIISLFIEAWVIGIVLSSEQGGETVRRRWPIGALFGLGVMTGVAMALGALLFILPAIFLAGRWFIAAPALMAENLHVTAAMQRSWDSLERHWLSGALLTIIFFLWRMLPLVADEVVFTLSSSEVIWPIRIATSVISEAGYILWFAATASMYILVTKSISREQEIFG